MATLEASSLFNLHACNPFGLQNAGGTRGKYGFSARNWRQEQHQKNQGCDIHALQVKRLSLQKRLPTFSISCSSHYQGCTDSEADTCNSKEPLVLKKRAEEIAPDLNGTSIFLVGMMGCGKTTVGRILSEALGYYFFDSDRLVEQSSGGASVAQIFKDKDEEFFRDAESKVLSQLSTMHRLVVATGGGAVVRPKNWSYLRHGITIWLDVPLEALAKRVVAVGTESRPLLGHDPANAYSQAFARLTELIEKRHKAYANSDARVSLEKIAAELGYEDVSVVAPTIIALEVMAMASTSDKLKLFPSLTLHTHLSFVIVYHYNTRQLLLRRVQDPDHRMTLCLSSDLGILPFHWQSKVLEEIGKVGRCKTLTSHAADAEAKVYKYTRQFQ